MKDFLTLQYIVFIFMVDRKLLLKPGSNSKRKNIEMYFNYLFVALLSCLGFSGRSTLTEINKNI